MIELVTTIIITVSSVLLFGYWFRYTCLLILNAKTTRDFAGDVVMANQLGFLEVQAQLRSSVGNLDTLCDALDRDYAVLNGLMKKAADTSFEGSSLEQNMLAVNYRVMRACYSVTGAFSPAAARKALEEMSMVVAHFANAMGQQAAAGAVA